MYIRYPDTRTQNLVKNIGGIPPFGDLLKLLSRLSQTEIILGLEYVHKRCLDFLRDMRRPTREELKGFVLFSVQSRC